MGFYDSAYWQSGPGELLWNTRKVLTFVNAVTVPNVRAPFFTWGWTGEDECTSVQAEWGSAEPRSPSLCVEWEDDYFMVFAFNCSGEYDFFYTFSYQEDATDPQLSPWSDLGKVVREARDWLKVHANWFPADPLNDLQVQFNLK